MYKKGVIIFVCLVFALSFISAAWWDVFTGKVTDESNFALTDEFNFWEDNSSHSYSVEGVTFKGP